MIEGVGLDFSKHWCHKHLVVFRKTWPRYVGTAMLLLFDAFARDERTIAMAPKKEGKAIADALPALVDECAPLCCFVGDEIVAEIVAEAIAGRGPRLDRIKKR